MDAAYREKVTKICTAAAAAPSGDNSQPWRFVFRAPNMLEFHAITEKDNELLNIDGSGTYIALGAAIQNAELEAKALGFVPDVRYSSSGSLVAVFVLHDGGVQSDEEKKLHQAIPSRHSNRKAYKKIPIAEDDRDALISAAGNPTGASFTLVEERESMSLVSRALTTMEEIALQNKSLHRLFFESIFWSKERNIAGNSGLYIGTLELPPPARLLFKVLKYWSVANVLAKLGFPTMVAKTNAAQNASASAFGLITIEHFDRRNYVEAGRLLERVWLAATAQGMSLQIVTGMLFLARTVERGHATVFSPEECTMVKKAYARAQETLKTDEPFLMFRVGYSNAPSAVSFRREPVIEGLH
ncbi:MAG: hypothetical protein Q7J45_03540 [bacterium]|nr:hypothetical protein [bacterium]